MSKVALIAIHGMGSQTDGFSNGLKEKLDRRLGRIGKDSSRVFWQEILWADLLEKRQRDYLEAAEAAGPLNGFFGLRRFIVSSLGDASAYQVTAGRPSSTYGNIHDRIRDRIKQLYEGSLESEPVPMVVFAHSLGGHIMSNYIWDTQGGKQTGAATNADDFQRMEWLAALVTFGSNIPLFTVAFKPVEPIRFPGNALPNDVALQKTWQNFYDRHDVLGYPLKPLSQGYSDVVEADIEINAGPIGLSATPMSHTKYWTDGDFVKAAAAVVARFL